MRILVVEDDEILLSILAQRLSDYHYAVDTATDGLAGWEYASSYEYDLLILDVVLPQLDGISLCQKLRQTGYTVPILLLTSQGTSTAKAIGFDSGADDYVVKPFDDIELIARIRALLRRGSRNPLPMLTWGDLCLNSSTQEVHYAGHLLDLTAKEYSLLEMMLQDSQHVFSKEEIVDSLWSTEEFPVEATVRSHMRRLRNKLAAFGAPLDLIATAHGRGYYLKPYTPTQSAPDLPVDSVVASPSPTHPNANRLRDQTPDRAQYLEFLNDTWQSQRSRCLQQVHKLRATLVELGTAGFAPTAQTEAYRIAHTLIGTLGTFGLEEATHMARHIEQELHPDIYPDPSQIPPLQALCHTLYHQLEATDVLLHIPGMSVAEPADDPQTPDLRVMMVDDDPVFLKTIPQQLQRYGFQVSTLDDSRQFWAVLELTQPAVLVLDVQMPHLNGLDLCQALRAASNWQKLPVLFLSVLADAKTQHAAFTAGADDYLCKPITAQTLSERIHLRLQRMHALFS
jgi:DNA-binding response OmpR family regulator/HPt (histidine-containing phosphotransfer) domain-containing protein